MGRSKTHIPHGEGMLCGENSLTAYAGADDLCGRCVRSQAKIMWLLHELREELNGDELPNDARRERLIKRIDAILGLAVENKLEERTR